MDISLIIKNIDEYLERSGQTEVNPVEANKILQKKGSLNDSGDRPGKPLRNLLREGKIPHAYQLEGKGSNWLIPHSKKGQESPSNRTKVKSSASQLNSNYNNVQSSDQILEAPPDNPERFFYYEDVKKHDYLLLGIAEALYPELKNEFIKSKRNPQLKKVILSKFKSEGFYLIDLSDLPIKTLKDDLKKQLPHLKAQILNLVDRHTFIILIKANVFYLAYPYLKKGGINNIVFRRIPFPGQGNQRKFHSEFQKALNEIDYLNKL